MPPITQHPSGAFCWFELATSDQAAAKRFYGALFGWDAHDSEMAPGEVYTLFRLQGRDVAAVYTLRKGQREQGVPPNWMVYVRVESADESATRAAAAGGSVLVPAFDVMEVGRMAVAQDPTGAIFCVWQPKRHEGTGLAGEHGTAVWCDLVTGDQPRAGAFYTELFGWQMVEGKSMVAARPGQYFHIANGGTFIGGIPPGHTLPPGVPAHWMIYFSVPDCRAAIEKAQSLGAKTIYGPMTIENTRTFAALSDPQGAVFALVDQKA